MQKTTGGAETSPVMDMLAGLCVVAAIHVKMTGGALARRDGALRLSEVGSQHGRGDKIGRSDGQCEDSVGVGGTARGEPAGGPVLADDDGSV